MLTHARDAVDPQRLVVGKILNNRRKTPQLVLSAFCRSEWGHVMPALGDSLPLPPISDWSLAEHGVNVRYGDLMSHDIRAFAGLKSRIRIATRLCNFSAVLLVRPMVRSVVPR